MTDKEENVRAILYHSYPNITLKQIKDKVNGINDLTQHGYIKTVQFAISHYTDGFDIDDNDRDPSIVKDINRTLYNYLISLPPMDAKVKGLIKSDFDFVSKEQVEVGNNIEYTIKIQ